MSSEKTAGWDSPAMLARAQVILQSYEHWIGHPLCPPADSFREQASTLFLAPFVVLAHGTEADPILCYGNQQAPRLFETDLEALLKTPSRTTAESVARAERHRMLERVARQGYIDNYCGTRIACSGRRFVIESAVIWNLCDASGRARGQAATFANWHYV